MEGKLSEKQHIAQKLCHRSPPLAALKRSPSDAYVTLTNPLKMLAMLLVALNDVPAGWQASEHPKLVTKRLCQSNLGRSSSPVFVEQSNSEQRNGAKVRVNKALRATHSRRQADALVADGRVTINNTVAAPGDMLVYGDVVRLDGEVVEWERLNLAQSAEPTGVQHGHTGGDNGGRVFTYIKFWKQRGVECTTDTQQPRNIIDALGPVTRSSEDNASSDRLFPVGRLDVDSTGLILLTSDGSIVNRLLRSSEAKRKEYLVQVDKWPTDAQIRRLAAGVTITTVAQRDGKRASPLTAPTKPCVVERTGQASGRELRFVLQEGRNRQIRRMCRELDLRVLKLHRIGFAGVTLQGCNAPGQWAHLSDAELRVLGIGTSQ